MNYSHSSKKLTKSQIEITVTITPEDFAPYLEKATRKLSEETAIKGFRPGKVPADVLKKQIGEMKIYEEAAALAAQDSYLDIATKDKIEPLGYPHVEFIKLAPGNEFIYKATVTLIPSVKINDYKSVKIRENKIEITDEQVAKVIEELRDTKAKEAISTKPAAMGDKVEIDFDVVRDNVPIDGGSQKKYPLIIGSNHFIPGFEENLVGLEINGEKEFELNFPEEYHNKNLAGKPAKFKVKILAIYNRELPTLDDTLAQGFGAKTLADLKEQIHHNLEHEEHHKEEERVERELLEALIAKTTFGELPDILINAETNKMIKEMESNISLQGLKFEDYLKHLNKTPEQLKLDFIPQAIKRVQASLLMRAIFFKENIHITEAEIEHELALIQQYYSANPEITKNFKTPEYQEYVRNMLGNRKVMDLLKTACVERTNQPHKC